MTCTKFLSTGRFELRRVVSIRARRSRRGGYIGSSAPRNGRAGPNRPSSPEDIATWMRAGRDRRIVALRVRDHIGVRTAFALVLAFRTAGCASRVYPITSAATYLPPYYLAPSSHYLAPVSPECSGPTRC